MKRYNTPSKKELLNEFGIKTKIKEKEPELKDIRNQLNKREFNSLIKESNKLIENLLNSNDTNYTPKKNTSTKQIKKNKPTPSSSKNSSKTNKEIIEELKNHFIKEGLTRKEDSKHSTKLTPKTNKYNYNNLKNVLKLTDSKINNIEQAEEIIKSFYNDITFIKKNNYDELKSGTKIMYVGNDDKLKNAMYIWKIHYTKDFKPYLILGQTPFLNNNPKIFRYIVNLDNIKYVWRINDISSTKQLINYNLTYLKDVVSFLQKKYGQEFNDFMNKREQDRNDSKTINNVKCKTDYFTKKSPKIKNMKTK